MAGALTVCSVALVAEVWSSMSSDRQVPERSSRIDKCMLTRAVNLEQLVVLRWCTRPSSNVELTDVLEDRRGIVTSSENQDTSDSSSASQLWNDQHVIPSQHTYHNVSQTMSIFLFLGYFFFLATTQWKIHWFLLIFGTVTITYVQMLPVTQRRYILLVSDLKCIIVKRAWLRPYCVYVATVSKQCSTSSLYSNCKKYSSGLCGIKNQLSRFIFYLLTKHRLHVRTQY